MALEDPVALAREAAMMISAQLAGEEGRHQSGRELEAERDRDEGIGRRGEKEEDGERRGDSDVAEKDGEKIRTTTVATNVTEVPASVAAETSLAHTIGLVLEEGNAEKAKEKRLETATALKETIDINDCRHRYHLIKSTTIEQVERETGAILLVRGKYYPDRGLATSEKEPPLSLEVAADSKTVLAAAIAKIQELMRAGPPSSLTSSGGGGKDRRESSSTATNSSKVFAPFELPPYGNIRQKILGPQGSYLKHIQTMTRTRVLLRGRGSGHVELGQREEQLEPLHLLVLPDRNATTRDAANIAEAVRLCEDLLATVRADLDSQQRTMSYYAGSVYGSETSMYGGPQGVYAAPAMYANTVPVSAAYYAPVSLPYPMSHVPPTVPPMSSPTAQATPSTRSSPHVQSPLLPPHSPSHQL